MRKRYLSALFLLFLSGLAAGCRQAERFTWIADARGGFGGWVPHRAGAAVTAARLQTGLADYMAGLLAEGRGDYGEAQQHYLAARHKDPANSQVLIRLGILHLENEELPEAVKMLEEAAARDPSDPRPRFVLGVLYMDQGRLEEASHQYAQILNQDPKNLGALSQLADLYVVQENVPEGLAVYERLLREKPDSSVAHFNVGVLYAKAQDWDHAIGHLAKAVELDDNFLEARLGLAVSLDLAGHLEESKEQFLTALNQEPVNIQLIHYLAQISYRLGDLEESARWLTRYLSFKPLEPAAHIELAYVRIDQGRWEEAANQLQLVMRPGEPEELQPDLLLALGAAYQAGRKYGEAEAAIRQASQIASPEDLRPALQLGGLYQRQQRFLEAEQVLHEAFQLHPDEPDLLNGLGYLYADWGVRLDEAVSLLERALRVDPGNGAFMDSLGWAYYKIGETQAALKLLEQAATRLPEQEVYEHLGQVYWKLGREEEALAAWNKGLRLESKDLESNERLNSNIRIFSGKRKGR